MTTVLKINDEPFLSTPSARRATSPAPAVQPMRRMISIHALREEGDPQLRQGQLCRKEFLSTPSARRATHSGGRRGLWLSDFYPRPPRGGRPYQAETRFGRVKFLSTPSARRATIISRRPPVCKDISIHALREEGDSRSEPKEEEVSHFYPRPPRGGRPVVPVASVRLAGFLSTPSARRATFLRFARLALTVYFYPRPPRGGRREILALMQASKKFLSTPSARRATAKTETKSLFSYKLYNILHEFRRALIYNGSKNDPNHAKRLENPVRRCRKDAENSPFAPGRETQNNSRPSCSKGG